MRSTRTIGILTLLFVVSATVANAQEPDATEKRDPFTPTAKMQQMAEQPDVIKALTEQSAKQQQLIEGLQKLMEGQQALIQSLNTQLTQQNEQIIELQKDFESVGGQMEARTKALETDLKSLKDQLSLVPPMKVVALAKDDKGEARAFLKIDGETRLVREGEVWHLPTKNPDMPTRAVTIKEFLKNSVVVVLSPTGQQIMVR